jgi:hypothetical protein
MVLETGNLLKVLHFFRAVHRIALLMEAGSTSETSVNLYETTWRNNPEDKHL